VRTLTRRHRRKTGSGPPADALIAWVGTDPYLRDAITTASHRRELALPLPYRSRSATAAMAVCIVLACGATVAIIEIISHGRTGQLTTTPPPVTGRDNPAARGNNSTPSGAEALLELPALPANGASPLGAYRNPAPMKPMLLEGGASPARSQPAPAPPSATASMPSSPESSIALPRIDEAGNGHVNKPDPASTRAQSGRVGDPLPHDPAGQPDAPTTGNGSGTAAGSIPPLDDSNTPVPPGSPSRPPRRGTGTWTGLPRGAAAGSETDHTGSGHQSSSDRRPVTSLGSTVRSGSAASLGTGNRTSRAGKNRNSGAVSSAR
jgi:hypothetical protein